MIKAQTQSFRDIDRNELQASLMKIGFHFQEVQQFELQFLSLSERDLVQIFCEEIQDLRRDLNRFSAAHSSARNDYSSHQQNGYDIVTQDTEKRINPNMPQKDTNVILQTTEKNLRFKINQRIKKIKELLEKVDLNGLKIDSELSKQEPYEAYKEEVEKFNKIHHIYTKMTRHEREQIYKQDWRRLFEEDKKFYIELAKINQLKNEYKQTQLFYRERIEKIKYDSSSTFNESTVKQAIDLYVSQNPGRINRNMNINSSDEQAVKNNGTDSEASPNRLQSSTHFTSGNKKMISSNNSGDKNFDKKAKGWLKDTQMNPDAPSFFVRNKTKTSSDRGKEEELACGSSSIPSNNEYNLQVLSGSDDQNRGTENESGVKFSSDGAQANKNGLLSNGNSKKSDELSHPSQVPSFDSAKEYQTAHPAQIKDSSDSNQDSSNSDKEIMDNKQQI